MLSVWICCWCPALILPSTPPAGLWWRFGAFGHCSDIIPTEFARQTDILSKIPSREEELGLCSEILQISVNMMYESQYCKDQHISCLVDFWFVYLSLTFSFSSYSQKIFQAHSILCWLSLSCYSSSWFFSGWGNDPPTVISDITLCLS